MLSVDWVFMITPEDRMIAIRVLDRMVSVCEDPQQALMEALFYRLRDCNMDAAIMLALTLTELPPVQRIAVQEELKELLIQNNYDESNTIN